MSIPQGGAYDLTIYQNASFSQVFSLRESDQTTAIDLTGYDARAQVRAGGALLATLTCDTGDPTDGDITVTATPAVTAGLRRSGFWSLEIDNGTNVYVLLEGQAVVHREITTP